MERAQRAQIRIERETELRAQLAKAALVAVRELRRQVQFEGFALTSVVATVLEQQHVGARAAWEPGEVDVVKERDHSGQEVPSR